VNIRTPAFNDGEPIPREFTCDGDDAPPVLVVSGVPEATRSLALIMDDPDAPKGTFTHWLVYDIPASEGSLAVGNGKTLANGFGRTGYGGPCPPVGHGRHRYYFTVFAVDVPSLGIEGHGRQALADALEPHTLETATVMGTYERTR
jgi:Raf kinase inhibitor-like YbhB/YbcL family protein